MYLALVFFRNCQNMLYLYLYLTYLLYYVCEERGVDNSLKMTQIKQQKRGRVSEGTINGDDAPGVDHFVVEYFQLKVYGKF